MDDDIRNRLFQLNPWLTDPSQFAVEAALHLPAQTVPRRVVLSPEPDPRHARMIVGPRQVGKSTLVWSALCQRSPIEVLYLNAEEALVQRWLQSPVGVLWDLKKEFPTIRVLFLEEAQNLDEAGLVVKGLIDGHRGLDVFVTGSSAFHLAARTRESLAGRAVRHVLLPFSLGELLDSTTYLVPAARKVRAQEILARQLVFGGYPAVWFSHRPEKELGDLLEAFVLRDASDRFDIRRPDAFRRLLQLLAGQVGQLANYAEWAALLGISVQTVLEYLNLLEESWIIHRLPPFAGGRRLELTKAPRVQLYDMGLRNAILGTLSADLDRRPDRGALLEGWVFGELYKALPQGWGLHFWRSKDGAEVDFVLVRGERLIAVEVKVSDRGRVSRSSRSFIDAYAPELFLIAGWNVPAREEQIGTTKVRWVALETLVEVLEAHLRAS